MKVLNLSFKIYFDIIIIIIIDIIIIWLNCVSRASPLFHLLCVL